MVRNSKIWPLMCFVASVCSAAEVSIRIEQVGGNPATSRFVLDGISAQRMDALRDKDVDADRWQSVFAVYAVTEGQAAPTAMLGEYSIQDSAIIFEPKYPLRPGITYRAVATTVAEKAGTEPRIVSKDFSIGEKKTHQRTAAHVTKVFPSADVLPENLLRFYLHFSVPMSRGEAYQRIHLQDGKGKIVEAPFLELGEELWSPDGQRFTLYFDPGRIKRGLQPRELFGPALREGDSYTLVIDREWLDANGVAMEKGLTKKFRVVAPDDVQPNPKQWKIQSPKLGSRQPLVVEFDEPLDSAMVERVISVTNPAGEPMDGTIRVESQEKKWLFAPTDPWTSGQYKLVVLKVLEDRSGNSIRRPFEVDILRPSTDASDVESVEIGFRVAE